MKFQEVSWTDMDGDSFQVDFYPGRVAEVVLTTSSLGGSGNAGFPPYEFGRIVHRLLAEGTKLGPDFVDGYMDAVKAELAKTAAPKEGSGGSVDDVPSASAGVTPGVQLDSVPGGET